MLFWLQILSVLVTWRGCVCEEKDALRIVGKGKQVAGARFSWVVRLVQHDGELQVEEKTCDKEGGRCGRSGKTYGLICTGSQLNRHWVLAAGHCSDATHVQLDKEVVGRGGEAKGVLFRKILQMHIHPAYIYSDTFTRSRGRLQNDIALYKTEEIKMKSYGQLGCQDYPALFGREVYFLGYGLTKFMTKYLNIEEKEKDLKEGPLMYGTGLSMDCATVKYPGTLSHLSLYFNFCVMRKCADYSLLSERDMGGPVVMDDKIVGINTVIIEDRKEDPSPDFVSVIATPVSPYIDWIQNLAKQSSSDFF